MEGKNLVLKNSSLKLEMACIENHHYITRVTILNRCNRCCGCFVYCHCWTTGTAATAATSATAATATTAATAQDCQYRLTIARLFLRTTVIIIFCNSIFKTRWSCCSKKRITRRCLNVFRKSGRLFWGFVCLSSSGKKL